MTAKDIEKIRAAFQEFESVLGGAETIEPVLKGRALRSIFKLNNEIGRLARTDPSEREALQQLQNHVNSITVGVKSGDLRMLRRGLESTRAALLALKQI